MIIPQKYTSSVARNRAARRHSLGLTACAALLSLTPLSVNAHGHHDHHSHHGRHAHHAMPAFTGEENPIEGVDISRCWVRLVPGHRPSAAYLDITNNNDAPVSLVAVRAQGFEDMMLHQTIVVDGQSRMDHVDAIEVPAGQTVQLKPKGLHIMLTAESPESAEVGGHLDLDLKFDGERMATIQCRVKPITALSYDE